MTLEVRRIVWRHSAFSPEGSYQLPWALRLLPPPPPPRRSPRCRGWQAVTDDAKEAALGMVDVGTLAKLKGVNHSWSALRCSAPTSSAARVSPRQVSG